jgi:cell division protein FtsL
MAAATAQQRHAARARTARPATRPQRRTSGPVARPRAAPAPKPVTGVFERLRGLPDHRVIDRLLRGRAWICLVGVALMGIVAMQVSLLKLNSGISRAVETTATLERQNSGLEASIARLASGERIRAAADKRGMVTPGAGEVRYLRVRSGDDARRAARRMRAPSDAAKDLMANNGRVPGALMAPVVPATDPATGAAPVADPAAATAPAPVTDPTTTAAAPVTPAVTPAPVAPAPTATQPDPATDGTTATGGTTPTAAPPTG